jgi:hypothetical protein
MAFASLGSAVNHDVLEKEEARGDLGAVELPAPRAHRL